MPRTSPPPDPIRSRRNPLVLALRELHEDRQARDRARAFVAEGVRLGEESLRRDAGPDLALVSPRLERTDRGRTLAGRLRARVASVVPVTDEVIAGITGMKHHQGVLLRVPAAAEDLPGAFAAGAREGLLLLCGIQDPGNLGGLVRVAAAAGVAAALADGSCADAWSPKAVRASAGAVFHLPVLRGIDPIGVLEEATRRGFRRLAAVARDGRSYREVDWRVPFVLVMGGEGAGLSPEVLARADLRVTVPLERRVESLNVLAAGTLLLFEARRPRP
ncbi:MAG: RNA methyltransferase [Acidobacteriota bacterium]